ncbi:MAG TPA: zinc ribbon domain-containing protein [Anaerolineaceae bacterium]|nr:zinc ribbon domain-containing protein [Anaerolineaceae bacterium]
MRPRRPFRRNMLRRLPPFPPPGAGAPPQLMEANRLFMEAKYVPAGERYTALAAAAEQRQLPQAAKLYLQAGRAFLLAHHPAQAEQLAQQGLHLFALQGRMRQLRQLGPRVIWEFESQGHKLEAQRLSAWLAGVLPLESAEGESASISPYPSPLDSVGERIVDERPPVEGLPRFCPSCGAPVDPRDVDWADDNTPMCAFCAIPLTGRV